MDYIKKQKKILSIIIIIEIAILLILIPIFGLNDGPIFLLPIYILIAVIFSILFYSYKIRKPFKEIVIPEILKKINPEISFIPRLIIKDSYIELIKKNKLIPSATTFHYDDGIIDKIGSYTVTSFDLHATHTVSTGKSTTTVTDFKGRFYDVDLNKYNCNFIIKEEILKRVPNNYEFLELESIDFNNSFNVYVTDKFEAFKIFTPSFIKEYYELVGLDNIKTILHYENKHLYIYLYNEENLFENMDENFEEILIDEYKRQYNNILQYIKLFDNSL